MFINVKRTFYDKMMRSEKNIWRNAKKRDSFVVGIIWGVGWVNSGAGVSSNAFIPASFPQGRTRTIIILHYCYYIIVFVCVVVCSEIDIKIYNLKIQHCLLSPLD